MLDQEIHRKPKLNFTPLIDIIFLLVVFFMLSTSFVKLEALNMFVEKQEAEEVSPNFSAAQKAVQQFNAQQVILQIGGEGMRLNGMEISAPELPQRLSEALQNSSNGKLKISVAEGVNVQELVGIIDTAQSSGAKDVEIAND